MERPSIDLRLDRLTRIVWLASVAVYGLGLVHFVTSYVLGWGGNGALRALNLTAEAVLPAWYSSIVLFTSGLLLLAIGLAEGRGSRTRRFWFGLGGIMLFMSADESAMLHEQSANLAADLGLPTDMALLAHPGFAWMFFGLLAVVVVTVFVVPMLRWIDRRTARRFVLAGVAYIFGALVMEFVGSFSYVASNGTSLLAGLSVTVEEGFEFLGLTLFLTALLDHYARHNPVLELRLHRAAEAARPAGASVRLPGAPAE